MIKIKRLGCVLLLIGLTATMVHSQDAAGDYVAPSEAVPRGKAPRMQVQLLNPGEPTKQYAVIFLPGRRGFFRIAGVCREVSRNECAFHRYWSAEWSDAGMV